MGKHESELEAAEIERAKAQASYYKALEKKEKLETKRLGLEIVQEERYEQSQLAKADESNIYTFYNKVDASSVNACMQKLGEWARKEPGCRLTIVLNSPGGSVIDGLALYDFLRELSSQGHHIEVVALGMAASMGGILLQAGDTRVIGQNAFVLIHEVSSFNVGSLTEMEDEMKFLKRLQDKCVKILASRSNLTEAQIRRMWKRKDCWLDSQETKSLELCDEIR